MGHVKTQSVNHLAEAKLEIRLKTGEKETEEFLM